MLLVGMFFLVACEPDPAEAYPVAVRDKLDFVAEPTDADCEKLACDPERTIVAYANDAVGILARSGSNRIIIGATFDTYINIFICNPEEIPAYVEYVALPDSIRARKVFRFDAVLRDACGAAPVRGPIEAAFSGVLTAAEIIDE